jgi:hypothetical protein
LASVPLLSPRETKGGARLPDCPQRCHRIVGAGDLRWVAGGTDDDEVVPGDFLPAHPVARVHERLFGLGVMQQDHIGVAAGGGGETWPRTAAGLGQARVTQQRLRPMSSIGASGA